VAASGHPAGKRGATTGDLATGAQRTSTRTDTTAILQHGQGELPTGLTLGVYSDLLVLVTVSPGGPALAAYRLSTLGPRWTSTVSALDVFVTRCGPWLCASDDHSINAIALDTGAPARTLTDAGHFRGWADGWMYDEPYLVEPDDATLVDPLTQRVMLHLGRWRIPEPSNTGPVLTMLPERHSNRTWIGLLTTGDGYLGCLTTSGQLRIWRYRR
jgi:hypothetical protein